MQRIEVKSWVGQYVDGLYEFRGWPVEADDVAEILDRQGDAWRRLMVQSGLNADQQRADYVAFEFNKTKVVGGPGRLFEAFAHFLKQNPKMGERAVNAPEAVAPSYCEDCECKGYMHVPMVNSRTGEAYDRAHRCHCLHGVKYAGLPAALPEMIEEVYRQRGIEAKRLGRWMQERGIPFGPDDAFRAGFRQWVDAQGGTGSIFQSVASATKTGQGASAGGRAGSLPAQAPQRPKIANTA